MTIKDGIKMAIGFYIGKELFDFCQVIHDDLLAVAIVRLAKKDGKIYQMGKDHLKNHMPRYYQRIKDDI